MIEDTYPEAFAVQVREHKELAWLPGHGQCQSKGRHAEGGIVEEDACCGQALRGWTALDHDKVQCCEEVVQANRDIAIEVEGEVIRSCNQSTCMDR